MLERLIQASMAKKTFAIPSVDLSCSLGDLLVFAITSWEMLKDLSPLIHSRSKHLHTKQASKALIENVSNPSVEGHVGLLIEVYQ